MNKSLLMGVVLVILVLMRMTEKAVRQIVALRPAALMMPLEMMEPMRERISSFLSLVIRLKSFLIVATLGSWASVTWMKTSERAMSAPCLTKSV